jgi:cytochrome c553
MLLAAAFLGSGLATPASAQDANLGRNLAASCAGCHGMVGKSVSGMPPVAGQPKEILMRTLKDYKDGKRPATIMHQLAKGYTDEQLELIAAYFAAQK